MTEKTLKALAICLPLIVTASSASAVVLAYDGFATDATGSGNNYQDGVNLEGIDKTRTGFTGSWFDAAGQGTDRNVRAGTGSLTYDDFKTGTAGLAIPFNNGTPQSSSTLARTLNITGNIDNGYYLAILIDYDGSEGGFALDVAGSANDTGFIRSGNNVTWEVSGSQSTGEFTDSVSNLGISDTSSNLIVLQYTNDTIGSPNANFYTRWNLWINPDLSGGSLGAVDFTGFGIGLLNGGNIAAPTAVGLSNARINDGQSISIDELYVTNDSADFISVPEPSTYSLMIGIAFLGFAGLWRNRRSS